VPRARGHSAGVRDRRELVVVAAVVAVLVLLALGLAALA
jgi:hypothetical protein